MTKHKDTKQKSNLSINPQLCKLYNSNKHDWSHSWLVEPKFDGLRCIVITDLHGNATPYSRNGKPLWNMQKILNEIKLASDSNPGQLSEMVLDGEVYTKDWNLSMSIVKRSTQTHPDQDKLHYHVWDCLTLGEWNQKYNGKVGISYVSNGVRRERLFPLLKGSFVEVVQGTLVSNNKELQEIYLKFLEQGYEGAVIKNLQGHYECGKRSSNWLKIKPWSDADLTIVGSYPGEGKHLGRIGGLVLQGSVEWRDRTYEVAVEAGTGYTDEERRALQEMEDKGTLAGKIAEIKFQDVTADGSLRFPVFYRLRLDKEDGK